jgi:hypothetical protein
MHSSLSSSQSLAPAVQLLKIVLNIMQLASDSDNAMSFQDSKLLLIPISKYDNKVHA